MEAKSPDHRQIRNVELGAKVASGEVVTTALKEDKLPLYLATASATGFKVEKIAEEGEEFPFLSLDSHNYLHHQKVSNIKVKEGGYIAVSIERPEGSRDHAPFWNNLKSLEQKKV